MFCGFFPMLKILAESLYLAVLGLKMYLSGSGATCFVPFIDEQKGLYWEQTLQKQYPQYFIKLTKYKTESHLLIA